MDLSFRCYKESMKKLTFLPFIFLMSLPVMAKVSLVDSIVYGKKDDRVLVTDLNPKTSQKYIEAGRSVLAMVTKDKVADLGFGKTRIATKSVANEFNICRDQRLSEQPSGASCTGFLVGPDTLVTAGHCIKDLKDCQSKLWVLDFKFNEKFKGNNVNLIVETNKTYNCKEIIARKSGMINDYAVIKLDRPVTGRKPLLIRREGKISKSARVYAIGYPLGIPQTLTRGAQITGNLMPQYFELKIDTFMGNSGSPIINEDTGVVEGILVKGGADADFSLFGACYDVNTCDGLLCDSDETAHRITTIKDFIK